MTMKNRAIKYYWVSSVNNLEEILLKSDNYFLKQLDDAIQYVFSKHELPMPEAVLFNRAPEEWEWGLLTITIVRGNIKKMDDVLVWYDKWIDIKRYLNDDAMNNSTEKFQYTFKLI